MAVDGLPVDGVPCTIGTFPVDGVPCAIDTPPVDGVPCTIGTSFAGISGIATSTRASLYSSSCSLSSLIGRFGVSCILVLSAQICSVLVSWGDEVGRRPVLISVTTSPVAGREPALMSVSARAVAVFKGCPQDPQKSVWSGSSNPQDSQWCISVPPNKEYPVVPHGTPGFQLFLSKSAKI